MREQVVYSKAEKSVFRKFRQFLMTPGQMLCFFGPELERHKNALRQLTEKELLEKEQFKGAYSLTEAGFEAMKTLSRQARDRGHNVCETASPTGLPAFPVGKVLDSMRRW